MNNNKVYLRIIKSIACILILLFVCNHLLFILMGYAHGIYLGKIPSDEIGVTRYLITFCSILSITWLSTALLGIWVFSVWMKIEESIKGKAVAKREEFWGILKVIKAYPLPIAFIALMYMVIIPIAFGVIRHIWVKIGIIK